MMRTLDYLGAVTFSCFGLLPFLWERCDANPDKTQLQTMVTTLPLSLFSFVWVLSFSPFMLAIAALSDCFSEFEDDAE